MTEIGNSAPPFAGLVIAMRHVWNRTPPFSTAPELPHEPTRRIRSKNRSV
jgi:hypothetical protein